MKAIIMDNKSKFPRFWTGHGWSDEYPNALIIKAKRELNKELRKILKTMDVFNMIGDIIIIENYGYDNEVIHNWTLNSRQWR